VDSEASAGKERFRRFSPELGLLLWAAWNPIGADVPLDEYESYVPTIWRLLAEGAEVDELSAHLLKITDEQIGGGHGTERAAAELLTRWWDWRF
jgi:hypothetical protein